MSRETPTVKRVAAAKRVRQLGVGDEAREVGHAGREGIELPVADLRLAVDERVLAELDAGEDAEPVVVALGRLGVALASRCRPAA